MNSESKRQLAVMGKFERKENVETFPESNERVRIMFRSEKIPGKAFETLEELNYEVEKVNGYSNHERKDAGYVEDYIHGMEILAKPQE